MRLRNLDTYVRKIRRELQDLEVRADVIDQFGRYRENPVLFAREVLGAESATRRSTGEAYQWTILEDLVGHDRVAVRSGHGIGKSTLDAWAALWWTLTRPYSRVVVVAPEFSRQVRAVLFAEIRKWVQRAPVALPLQVMSNRVTVDGHGDEWGVIGLPATEPHRIEGFHAEGGVLLILDETKGIPDAVYDALQGALTGESGNRLLVSSTPGAPTGIFHRIFADARHAWRLHHLPASDSSLVSEAWVEQRREEWGEDSPIYVARVLGEFPEDEEGVLYRLGLLEAAVDRTFQPEKDTQPAVFLGVDPARFGPDRTGLAVWRGRQLVELESRQGMDIMETASWISARIREHSASRVRVDGIGIGAGLVDRLRQLGHPVEDVNVARAASQPELFVNQKAELAWRFREALEAGSIGLPDHEGLLAELSAFKYDYDPKGRIVIGKKGEVRRSLGRSPDLADAALLGFGATLSPAGRYALIGGMMIDTETWERVIRPPRPTWIIR